LNRFKTAPTSKGSMIQSKNLMHSSKNLMHSSV